LGKEEFGTRELTDLYEASLMKLERIDNAHEDVKLALEEAEQKVNFVMTQYEMEKDNN
jgi:archaellum component FlaC